MARRESGTRQRTGERAPAPMDPGGALDRLPAITWTTDLDLRLTGIGGALGSLVAGDEASRLTLYRLLQTSDRVSPPVAAHHRALHGEPATFKGVLRGRAFHARVDPLRDDDGAIVGTIGVAVPAATTDDTAVLDPLGEPSIRAIFEGAAIGIGLLDLHHQILAVNRALEEMLGYGADELRGVNLTQVTHPEDLGVGHALFDELVRGQRDHYRIDCRYIRKDAQIVSAQVSASLVRDAAGRPQFVVAMVQDVTEHSRADRELLLLQTLTLAISDAPDFLSALATTIREVCEHTGWGYGQAWVPSDDGDYIDPSPAWYARSPRYESFRLVSAALRFAPGLGLPGRVWASQEPVLIPDLLVDGDFLRRDPAHDAGLEAAVAVPVLADGAVVAVLEFFMAKTGPDTRRLVALVTALGAQLGSLFQRKLVEGSLKAAEARFRMLVEIAPDIIFSTDAESGTLTALNPAFETLTGWTADEWIGGPYSALIHPDDVPRLGEIVERVRRGETPAPFEERVLKQSGDWMTGELRVKLRMDGDRASDVIGIMRDVTERRHDEERLREANQLLEAIVGGSPMGIVTVGRDGRLTSYNPAAERIMGWPAAQVLGKTLPRTRLDDEHADTRRIFDRVFRGESLTDIEVERTRKDGTTVVLSASVAPLRAPDGTVTGLVGTFSDVTGRKQAERELAQTIAALDERTKLLEATLR